MLLYAATSNPGKLAEFATSASTSGIEVLGVCRAFKRCPNPLKTPTPLWATPNSRPWPTHGFAPGLLVFADDSGLAVDALNSQPGVRSARFADELGFEPGSGSKDDRNNRCLLSLLSQHPNRTARFVCNLALARDGQILLRAEGIAEGQLLHTPRGADGFGYDPSSSSCLRSTFTLAEVPREQKWQISHRGNAFRSLLQQLQNGSR